MATNSFTSRNNQVDERLPSEVFPVSNTGFSAPEATVRNRAATVALLGNPEDIDINYQVVKEELENGDSSSFEQLSDQAKEGFIEIEKERGLLPLLSSGDFSIEEKQLMLEGYSNRISNVSLDEIIQTESLIAPDENDTEETSQIKINSINAVDTYRARAEVEQEFVNRWLIENNTDRTFLGTASQVVESLATPAYEGILASNIVRNLSKRLEGTGLFEGSSLKALALPGSAYENIKTFFDGLNPDKRLVFIEAYLETLNDNKGIILNTENQAFALDQLNRILGGSFSGTSENIWNLLDITLTGAGVAGTAAGAIRTTRTSRADSPAPTQTAVERGRTIPEPPRDKEVDKLISEREILEESRDILVEQSSRIMEKGQVSEARKQIKDIEAEIYKLEAQLSKRGTTKSQIEDSRLPDLQNARDRLVRALDDNAAGEKAVGELKVLDAKINTINRKIGGRVSFKKKNLSEALEGIGVNRIVSENNPLAVGNIILNTNVQRSRTLVKAVLESGSEELAMAAFGTNRLNVLADMLVPKYVTRTGDIPAKPVGVLDEFEKGVDLTAYARSEMPDGLTRGEVKAGSEVVINDFLTANGIRAINGMDGISKDLSGSLLNLSTTYGNARGPFIDAKQALDQVQLSLAKYGVTEKDLTLMKRDGPSYTPTTLKEEAGKSGDYLVKVNYEHKITTRDVPEDSLVPYQITFLNFLDRAGVTVSTKHGSITRHLFSPANLLDRDLIAATTTGVKKASEMEKKLLTQLLSITNQMKKLGKAREKQVIDYWIEANAKGIKLTTNDLVQRNFNEAQRQVAKDWRNFQDTLYELENIDFGRRLSRGGYQLLDNGSDRFIAKPIGMNTKMVGDVYDVSSGKVVKLKADEIRNLYNNGGTVAELRGAEVIDGKEITHLMVPQNTSGYLRRINDTDTLLNYRDGYFQRTYKAKYFITKTDAKTGKVHTVGVARDRVSAEHLKARLTSNAEEGITYGLKNNNREIPSDNELWDLYNTSGRIAQRRRGETLRTVEGDNIVDGLDFIESPIDSALRAASSISGRTAMRDILANAKDKFMAEYGDMFSWKVRYKGFPKDLSGLSEGGLAYSKRAGEARTAFEYIHSLENGYINSADDVYKGLMNLVSDGLADASLRIGEYSFGQPISKFLSKAERGTYQLANKSPTAGARGAAFTAYLALNPPRQLIVQTLGYARMSMYDPVSFADPRTSVRIADYVQSLVTNKTMSKDTYKFAKFLEEGGLVSAVERSNLVRASLVARVDQSSTFARSPLGTLARVGRTVGYDIAEKLNIINHASLVYTQFKRKGANLSDPFVKEQMFDKIDAITYRMSRASDMPYNENWLSAPLQFMQVPHKAILQAFDLGLTRGERLRLLTADAILYGGPVGALVYESVNKLFGDDYFDDKPELRDAITRGVMDTFYNEWFKEEGDLGLDITGSLSPLEFDGMFNLAALLMGDATLTEFLTNTPSGMLFSGSGRVNQAVQATFRLMGFIPDSEIKPETIGSTLNSIASISSGWNNARKAMLMHSIDKIMTSTGQVIQDGVPTHVAIGQAFGVQPRELVNFYENNRTLHEDSKEWEENAAATAREIIKLAVSKSNAPAHDRETLTIAQSLLWRQPEYHNNPKFMQIFNTQLNYAMREPDSQLTKSLMELLGNPDLDPDNEVRQDFFRDNPEAAQKYKQLNEDVINAFKNANEGMK